MNKYTLICAVLCLMIGNVKANELVLTFKPSSGLSGISSLNFHEDGKVTLLIYESATKITETPVTLKVGEIASLKKLATNTLNEYLSQQQFKNIKTYQLTASIALKVDAVTKSISTRKLTANMITLVKQVNPHLPEKFRLKIVEKSSNH